MAGPSFKVEFRGLPALVKRLDAQRRNIGPAVASALYREAEETITDAKRITPVDEGVLRSSGHVQLPVQDGDRIVVQMGFGGPAGSGNHAGDTNQKDVGYAVYVHEDLDAHHPVGQAKFLEQPLGERRGGFADRVARRVEDRLSRG